MRIKYFSTGIPRLHSCSNFGWETTLLVRERDRLSGLQLGT